MDYFDLSAINEMVAEPIVPITEEPKKTRFAQKAVSWFVGGAVSSVVVSAIHQNTTAYNRKQQLQLYVGAYVLGAMAADKAVVYTEERTRDLFVAIENFLWIPVEPDPWTPILVTIDPTTTEDPNEQ